MNECEITPSELVEAAEDATEMLQLAEQAFDPGAFLVEAPVGLACAGARRMGWDDGHRPMPGNPDEDGVAVIGASGESRLDGDHGDRAEQGESFWRVTRPACGQREAERIAEAIGQPMQLARIPAP